MQLCETSTEQETLMLGRRLGAALGGGEVVALDGDLGAGKTVFVKGLAMGLGIAREILSPTFTLVREYQGRVALYHFDVYRLGDADELFEIGFDEYLDAGGVVVVEWAERIRQYLPEETLFIKIERKEGDARTLHVCGPRELEAVFS